MKASSVSGGQQVSSSRFGHTYVMYDMKGTMRKTTPSLSTPQCLLAAYKNVASDECTERQSMVSIGVSRNIPCCRCRIWASKCMPMQ